MAKWRDHPGLISETQHQRLRNLGHYAHPTKAQPSKMASFDDKTKVDEHLPKRGVKGRDAIDQDQRMNSAIASQPTRAGGVGGSKVTPKADAINQNQKPKFPAGGEIKKRGAWKSHRGGKVRPSGPLYGGPNSRP